MATRSIANQIRRLRFEPGEMTKSDLAERIGMTRQTIMAIEAGKCGPSLEAAFRVAPAFNVGIEDVFDWDEAHAQFMPFSRSTAPAADAADRTVPHTMSTRLMATGQFFMTAQFVRS